MENRITLLDWICIALYSLGVLGISWYHSRKIHKQDDVFLAGRSMTRWPIAISMYMALFSTNTFLGATGWVNRPDGTIWIGLQTVGIVLAVPLIVWLYPTLFFRLRITSAYEYLDKRFSHSVRDVATLFFLGSRIVWMSTILYSASLVVSTMLGWTPDNGMPKGGTLAVVAIGGLATFFALLGGMHGVIWTDVMQFFVLLGGLVAMIGLGLASAGGIGSVIAIGQEFHRFRIPTLFSLTEELSFSGGLLLGFVGMLSSAGADQVILQQYLTAKSDREAKASLWRNGLFLKPVSLIYPFLGLIMFAYYRTHPEVARLMRIPDDALPVYVINVLPSGARGLMIVAMIAAVLTSIQSGLAAVAAAIQVNFVQRWMTRPMRDREAIRWARGLMLGMGLLILVLACFVERLGQKNSIIQVLNMVMFPFAGVLLGIFLLGILSHRANAPGVLIGGIAGFLGTIAVPACKTLLPAEQLTPLLRFLVTVSTFYYGFLGTVLTIMIGLGASLLFQRPGPSRIIGLTRRCMPEPEPAPETTKVH